MDSTVRFPQVPTPPGLEAVYSALRVLYPDQPNPLQVTALLKYWLNGPDPLDFVSMFHNPGQEHSYSSHWHYISSGLSDLHGDGRVHVVSSREGTSGYGFELTFRLKKEPNEQYPPPWPAELLQSLAKYVFETDHSLCAGDHIPWHLPLDAQRMDHGSVSHIQHMIITEDPQLPPLTTPLGSVKFLQVVGVFTQELQAAQYWNGNAVLDLMRKNYHTGGSVLVTDMKRRKSLFDIDPTAQEKIYQGVAAEGSTLSGVSAHCYWEEQHSPRKIKTEVDGTAAYSGSSGDCQISGERRSSKDATSRFQVLPPINPMVSEAELTTMPQPISGRISVGSSICSEQRPKSLRGVHLRFNLEAATFLLLAIRGRLRHGHHFTFVNTVSNMAITFVCSQVAGAFVNEQNPYAAHSAAWLQVYVSDEFLPCLEHDLQELTKPHEIQVPKDYSWPEQNFSITIASDSSR